jgi:hypothetical protein
MSGFDGSEVSRQEKLNIRTVKHSKPTIFFIACSFTEKSIVRNIKIGGYPNSFNRFSNLPA